MTELPKYICQSCVDSLNSAYAFKEQCEERRSNLLNIINSNKIKFLTDQNFILFIEPQIDISVVKNEELNPLELGQEVVDDEFGALSKIEVKDELEVLAVEADVKSEEIDEEEIEDEDTETETSEIKENSIKNYVCDLCDEVFKKQFLLKKHKATSHDVILVSDYKYSCNLCIEKFRYKREFFLHRKSHTTCPECNKDFPSDRKMLQHLRVNHLQGRRKSEACHICGKVVLKQNLSRHIRSYHNKEVLHFCDVCNKGFYESALLKIHMTIHSESRPYNCDICAKTFKTQKHLDLHKKTHLDGEHKPKNIPCQYCEKLFCSMKEYDIHLQEHPEHTDSFQCNVCNRKFALEARLKLHAKIHIRPFKICQICGKSLASLASFNTHMRIHTNEKPFKCSMCPKQYKQGNQLAIHKRCHSGERPYKCKLCNLAFRQRNHLDTHQNVHSTEKKFSCDICGVCVGYKYNLISHIKNVHQKERNYQCKHCTECYFSNNMLKKHLQQKHKDLIDL